MAEVSQISDKINLSSALWYAEQGWYVFPLYEISKGQCSCPAGSRCGAPGKHPRTQKGFKDASIDPNVISRWWRQWPQAGIGIATGLSNLVVLDIDPRNQGDTTLTALEKEHGKLPPTRRHFTGGDGDHHIFEKPQGDFDCFVLGQGIDVKADGGYIVAPPTWHISGKQYRVDPDAPTTLAPLPEWVVEKKKQKKKARKSSAKVTEGFMGAAMEHAGWLGKAMGLDRTAVKCPWQSAHTGGVEKDGSSVVFAPVEGSRTGYAHCSHSHCSERSQGDWLDALPEESKQVARERLKMDENYTPKIPAQAKPKAENWKHSLTFDQHGQMTKEPGNLELILTNDAVWDGCLAFDEFKGQKLWMKQPPEIDGMLMPAIGQVLDHHVVYVQQYFKKHNGVSFGVESIRSAVDTACFANPFHPVRDYLDSLVWDGQPRVCRWLATYMGAKDDDYTRMVSPWWFLAPIARVFAPGCKVDTVPIFEGDQGVGKSSAVRVLADPWSCDTPIVIGDKDAYLTMRGRWFIELAELESLDKAAAAKAKAFFTSPTDTYRAPYGREIIEVPRQCVFVGTVNHGEYLRDDSGGRRFLPVRTGKINLDLLTKHKDQLWAEAVTMYRCGEVWWPRTPDENRLCGDEQKERYVEDEWNHEISEYAEGKSDISVRSILTDHFKFLPREWTRAHEMRVASCLKRLKFKREKSSSGWVWNR